MLFPLAGGGKDLDGNWGVLGGRQIILILKQQQKPLYRVMHGFLGCLRFVFYHLSQTFLPSTADHRTFRDRTSENRFWQKGPFVLCSWGSCSCKLLSNIFLMFSLGSHCLGDPIPWRRLLPEIRFLQLGVDRPGLCLRLMGGLSPSPLETDVFPALTLLGFPSKVSPISGLSNTLYHLADTLILLPHWGEKKVLHRRGS